MIPIGGRLRENVTRLYGDAGTAWLDRLPGIVSACAERWSIDVDAPFASEASWIAPARRADGDSVVLKVVPMTSAFLTERTALRWFDGSGAVRVLAWADADRALLLEHVRPGDALHGRVHDYDDDATLSAAAVMGRLWQSTVAGLPLPDLSPIAQDAGALRAQRERDPGGATIPHRLMDAAEATLRELVQAPDRAIVLHGDLHHDNLVRSDRDGWLAIDPKGRLGEAACETAALIRNPMPFILAHSAPGRLLARRVDLLGEVLQIERARLAAWAFALALVAVCWQVEDRGEWAESLHVAQLLASIRRGA